MTLALTCIALLGLLVFGLGFAVSTVRGRSETLIGSPTDPADTLHKWVRAHGNATEYAPMLGLLILLTGLNLGFTPMLFLFSVVYGLNIGGTEVQTSVGIANYFGRDFVGTIRGTMMAITTSSVALGPVLVSMAYDAQGTYFRAFEVLVGLFLISAIVVLFAKPPTKAEQASPAQGDL